jgi:hypothetical protein
MERLILRLPYEILRDHILPYTYHPQDGELLGDIISFRSTWTMIEWNYKEAYRALELRSAVYPTMMHNIKRYCHPGIGYRPGFSGHSFWCKKWCRTMWSRWAPYRRQYFVAEKVPILQRIYSRAATMDADQRQELAYSARGMLDL